MKPPRPASIVITQALMLFSLGLITLGFSFVLLKSLFTEPGKLLSLKALAFFAIALGLPLSWLVYGFGGLWKRKRSGYWLGLAFLVAVNVKNIYSYVPGFYKMAKLAIAGSLMSNYTLLGYGSAGEMVVDVAVQSVLLLLIFILMLKVCFGERERKFFTPAIDGERV